MFNINANYIARVRAFLEYLPIMKIPYTVQVHFSPIPPLCRNIMHITNSRFTEITLFVIRKKYSVKKSAKDRYDIFLYFFLCKVNKMNYACNYPT